MAVDGTWTVRPTLISPAFLGMVSCWSVYVVWSVGRETSTVTGRYSLDARTITAEKIMPYIVSVWQRSVGGSALTIIGDD